MTHKEFCSIVDQVLRTREAVYLDMPLSRARSEQSRFSQFRCALRKRNDPFAKRADLIVCCVRSGGLQFCPGKPARPPKTPRNSTWIFTPHSGR